MISKLTNTDKLAVRDYRSDADFNLQARMVVALDFVPLDNVVACFEELERICPTLQPILDWLESSYIGILRRDGSRRLPVFPIPTWNLYSRVMAEQMKTNNIAEAAHRRLQAQLNVTNPTIWKFITEMKKVQAERDIYYEFLVAGSELSSPKNGIRYVQAGNHILRLVQNYEMRENLEFLRGLAHNFVMDN